MLWAFYDVTLNPETYEYEVIPLRDTSAHWNILTFLENSPCDNCFQFTGFSPGPDGTLNVEITITQPFDHLNFTAFDVRGIVMFKGLGNFPEAGLSYSKASYSSMELLNADGFTTLYNPDTEGSGPGGLQGYIQGKLTPYTVDVQLSGFKRFISDDPSNTRNFLLPGDSVARTYNIYIPVTDLKFCYAVDACWAMPDVIPVVDPITDFPPEANCEEPWKIDVTVEPVGDGLTPTGGSVIVRMQVYDHTGMVSHLNPKLECPDLYNGVVEAGFIGDFGDYSVWEALVSNEKLALNGTYNCLISVEDTKNDPGSAPWLDLTAYQVIKLVVDGEYSIIDVTPPELQSILNHYCYDLYLSNGYAYITGCGPKLYIVDISVPEEAFIAASYTTSFDTVTVVVENNIAYLTAFEPIVPDACELILLDVTDPTQPEFISSHSPSGYPHGISGDIGVSSAGMLGFMFHDLNPPESAHYVDKLELSDWDIMMDIEVLNGYVYALRGPHFHIVDFDPIETAAQIGTVETQCYERWRMDAWDNYLFISGMGGIEVHDITDRENPSFVTFINTGNMPNGIKVKDGVAFVTTGVRIELWDVDPPTEAQILQAAPSDWFERIEVEGNYIYMVRPFSSYTPFTIMRFE
jgi:hypothetical protein